jgi:ABC-type transport system involved in cytochrome bd biosynthesis fused ATPase/permease subunit
MHVRLVKIELAFNFRWPAVFSVSNVIKRIYVLVLMLWIVCQQRAKHSSSEFIKLTAATRLYMDRMHGLKIYKFKQQNRRNNAQQYT